MPSTCSPESPASASAAAANSAHCSSVNGAGAAVFSRSDGSST